MDVFLTLPVSNVSTCILCDGVSFNSCIDSSSMSSTVANTLLAGIVTGLSVGFKTLMTFFLDNFD